MEKKTIQARSPSKNSGPRSQQTQTASKAKGSKKKEVWTGNQKAASILVSAALARCIEPSSPGSTLLAHIRRGGSGKDIPFLLPMLMKKNQIVEVRLVTDFINIAVTNATNYSTVQVFKADAFSNYSDLKNVFDQVRPSRGRVYYVPRYTYTGGTSGGQSQPGGAAIDVSNASAFGSSVSMLQHDNHVMFSLMTVPVKTNHGRFSQAAAIWDFILDYIPETSWQDTANPVAFAWWKPWFSGADVTSSVTAGYLIMECILQFRGMK
jgi:PBP1b-binding outer membrane lipoprotein LpoB